MGIRETFVQVRERSAVSSQLEAEELNADKLNADRFSWPSQAEVAEQVGVTRGRIGQIVGTSQDRWAKEPAITQLRTDLVEIVTSQGGVMTVPEAVEAVLVARGSSQEGSFPGCQRPSSRWLVLVCRSQDTESFSLAQDQFLMLAPPQLAEKRNGIVPIPFIQ